MSNPAAESKRLTTEDPIDPEILAKFGELEQHRMHLGSQVLDLRSEEVKLMVAARRIDEEKQRLFEKVLVDRGLNPSTPVEIDASTGRIRVLQAARQAAEPGDTTPAT